MLHKPVGVVSTHADEHGRETVYSVFAHQLSPLLQRVRWDAVGRLDLDTSGLLLITNDGGFVHFGTHPGSGVTKTYHALVKGLLDDRQLAPLRRGVELSGGLGRSAPAVVEILGHRTATTELQLTLGEGKNREVRRMLLAIDSQVIRLTRVRVNDLVLDVPERHARRVTDDELRTQLGFTWPPDPGPARTGR